MHRKLLRGRDYPCPNFVAARSRPKQIGNAVKFYGEWQLLYMRRYRIKKPWRIYIGWKWRRSKFLEFVNSFIVKA